ncbi:serine hydrolase domain-containing protein [Kineosporia succinea]|uniref:CubicO group peptidase (Beta-lactamase class C family) n=1 Tax=Kineosporia succinea TaxID=84632 RepID=A0ABT9P104_9ACTN|nr:serine hydrolase domain-containing protein [Kineosporia succinea]MDP9826094.1 CubicO group peptidase (beta-lactamase class C family) [Kineosporia succinea]
MSALTGTDDWEHLWGVPNTSAVVITADGTTTQTRGDADREYGLASVTKLLTAYAVLVALEEEALALTDPAGPPGSTVEHLLAHTAGYGFESGSPAVTRPGSKRVYSNQGIEVLARHLAEVTGIDFGTYLSEAVLAPLGMTATTLPGSPAAGGRSTADDLARFAAELLDPKLIDRATLDEATRVHFPGLPGILPGLGRFDPLDWGLGFERNFARPGHWAGTRISPNAFGHFGAGGTFLWVDPDRGLACVCLSDLAFGDWSKQAWPALTDDLIRAHG